MVTDAPHYIATVSDLERTAETLEKQAIIGVDLEADSMFHFEERVCLIQIATEDACFIVDPLYISDMSALAPVFANPDIVKVFHGADYDVRSMYRDFKIHIENLFDTELACRFLGYSHSSLEAVLKQHFDVVLDKKYQKKDWSVRPLPEEMVAYAASDVRCLIDLYRELKDGLIRKNRYQWMLETGEDIIHVRYDPEENGDRPLFLKVKGAGRLEPRTLAVLENLLQFRLEVARKKDRPPFKILGSKALLELATIKPDTPAKLSGTRSLSEKQYHMYGQQIVQAIGDALMIPSGELPRYPRTAIPHTSFAVTRRIKTLKKWRDQKGDQLEMDPAMIVNKAAMRKIAELCPEEPESLAVVEELKSWQIEAFGREWIQLLSKTG